MTPPGLRFLVCFNDFKGSLSASKANEAAVRVIKKSIPDSLVTSIPLSDGGPGFLKTVPSCVAGRVQYYYVTHALGQRIRVPVLHSRQGIAYIESAKILGLRKWQQLKPLAAHSRGLGELIIKVSKAARKIVVGLGGTISTDAGIGAAQILGWRFYNSQNRVFNPGAAEMENIVRIKAPVAGPKIPPVEIWADVMNPLTGPTGAARCFAAQKGAVPDEIALLERGLTNLKQKFPGLDKAGAGAAGGLGWGLEVFFGGKRNSGSEQVRILTNLGVLAKNADIIVSGEGTFDRQSILGKGIDYFYRHYPEKLWLVVGNCEKFHNMRKTAEFVSLQELAKSRSRAVLKAAYYVKCAMLHILEREKK